jgi:hypothetical protein
MVVDCGFQRWSLPPAQCMPGQGLLVAGWEPIERATNGGPKNGLPALGPAGGYPRKPLRYFGPAKSAGKRSSLWLLVAGWEPIERATSGGPKIGPLSEPPGSKPPKYSPIINGIRSESRQDVWVAERARDPSNEWQ